MANSKVSNGMSVVPGGEDRWRRVNTPALTDEELAIVDRYMEKYPRAQGSGRGPAVLYAALQEMRRDLGLEEGSHP